MLRDGLDRLQVSIHAPRGGSDSLRFCCDNFAQCFNPRSPWGERRSITSATATITICFNPRSPWGERQVTSRALPRYFKFQSTLPVGGATATHVRKWWDYLVSIHAPRGGSDTPANRDPSGPQRFQSTLPVGGATVKALFTIMGTLGFNPRSPWGERPWPARCRARRFCFNPRSPWGERHQRRTDP